MLEKKISLEEIFDNNFNCYTNFEDRGNYNDEPAISKDKFKELCIDFGKQVLELAAKNAKISHNFYKKDENYKKYYEFEGIYSERYDIYGDSYGIDVFDVDKQSILNTINQIE